MDLQTASPDPTAQMVEQDKVGVVQHGESRSDWVGGGGRGGGGSFGLVMGER